MLKQKRRNTPLATLNIVSSVALVTISGLLIINSISFLKKGR
jgi:hypothetical protein